MHTDGETDDECFIVIIFTFDCTVRLQNWIAAEG